MIRITKDNLLNIPINTQLHEFSFFDKVREDGQWNTKSIYVYEDIFGNICTIGNRELHHIRGCYKNVIVLSNCKLAIEGEEYYKVFSTDNEAKYHKLEFNNGKHYQAIVGKIYKDIVYDNTNSSYIPGLNRFKTYEEAEKFSKAFIKP